MDYINRCSLNTDNTKGYERCEVTAEFAWFITGEELE